MKIIKFSQFRINENLHDSPEEYVGMALKKIKSNIEKMFEKKPEQDVEKFSDKNKKDGGSLSDFNLELQSCEISKYSKTQDNVKAIYSDSEYRYDLIITINLEDAVPKSDKKDFNDTDIKKCYLKFKVYSIDDIELVGEVTKTIDIDKIDSDLLTSLKIEVEGQFGDKDSDLELELEN